MGFFSAISKAVFREYDRRIKRASLITEYGAAHHGHADAGHNDTEHTAAEHAAQHPLVEPELTGDNIPADEGAEIVNVPRGTPVEQAHHE